jgi:hypothetical protein
MAEKTTPEAATLADLFPFPAEDVSRRLAEALGANEDDGTGDSPSGREGESDSPTPRWSRPVRQAVAGEVSRRFAEVLDVPVSNILMGAFDQYTALLEYADTSKYPPGESVIVPLGEHTIESRHEPKIDVLMNDKVVLSVALTIGLEIDLESVVLRIQGGRIYEIRPGRGSAKGSVKFRDLTIVARESSRVDFPGTIRIERGLPIRPGNAEASQAAGSR